MTLVKSNIIRKLMDAKKFISDGLIDEGLKIISDVVKSSTKEEYNWFICNLLDSVKCKYMFEVLDKVANYFDMSRCQNIGNIVDCGIENNVLSTHVNVALDLLVAQNKRDKLEELSKIALKNNEIKTELLVALANSLKRVGAERDATTLLIEACKKGNQQACNSINAVTVRSVM